MEFYFPNKPRMMGVGLVYLLVLVLMNIKVNATVNVNITRLQSAPNGAACLDGSPPAYYFYEGVGDNVCDWIVYLEGGGWCNTTDGCVEKSKHYSGSSYTYPTFLTFSGMLDNDCEFNPDFCHWNKVIFHYCDGSSFSSNIEAVDPRTNITYRGARVYDALIEEMMKKGLGNANNAILAGSSAGGLSTVLHCDRFRALLPNAGRVKCISDSGFFIRGDKEGLPGIELREIAFARDVVQTHELASILPRSCTSKRNADLCLFPQYLVGDVETPLFIIESAFDKYQVEHNLLPAVVSVSDMYNCTENIAQCNATLISILKDFRSAFIETLMELDESSSRGMFVHNCFRHVHIIARNGWTCSSVECNVVAYKTIGEAVSDWYFDRSTFHEIDTYKDTPFNCTTLAEDDPKFIQKCVATLPPS